MRNYEEMLEKIKVEFKKIDKSLSFFNCLEQSFIMKVPIDLYENEDYGIETYNMKYEQAVCIPYTKNGQKMTNLLMNLMSSSFSNVEYLYNHLSFIKEHIDLIRDSWDGYIGVNHKEEFEEFGIEELVNKNIWIGDARFIYPSSSSPYFEIPILIFNEKTKDKYELFGIYKEQWEIGWDEATYDEVGRRTAARYDLSLSRSINDIHIIASIAYEGIECKGAMLLKRHKKINPADIYLDKPVPIGEHKRIRKLLETTNENFVLLVDTDKLEVYGFKSISSALLPLNGDILINFKGLFSWECKVNNELIFYFEKLQFKFPADNNNEANILKEKLLQEFDLKEYHIRFLSSLIETAREQEKGTILVLLDNADAKDEASRLSSSSTLIKPIDITPEIVMNFSKIDGASIIDTKGICYSFGVILDGDITEGDPGRGARYNSALRYIKTKKNQGINCLIVVVSEDGYVDVLITKDLN
ncbi:diadenylate cyclase [Priestia aryabhattai]|uniref:DNA integrity scanning protein DisA nucleotide-binding domain protein n=1 Tax=Priestia aryabhattai TaxID=412384 RepID=UPI003D26CB86